MSELLKKIETEILNLPAQERAFLADRLLSSLDENALSEVDIAWVAEAERRYDEYKQGKRKGTPADKVFEEAEKLLK